MEEVLSALQTIQKELAEQKITIQKSGEKMTDQVTQNINKILDEKFKLWEDQFDALKTKVDNQEKRLYFLEKQARARNIVFFGLEETENSYSNLEINLINFIERHLSTKLDRRDIQEVKRIGRKGEKPRPIVVTFSTLGLKIDIYKQRTTLKDTPYYLKEDYPHYVLEKRKELQKQILEEKEKGNIAIIKYDKLVIMNKKTTNNNKRMISTSPENSPLTRNKQKTQVNKKNKIHAPIQRSSSLSEGVLKPGLLNFLTTNNSNYLPSKQDHQNKKI